MRSPARRSHRRHGASPVPGRGHLATGLLLAAAAAASGSGCAGIKYKPTELNQGGEHVTVVERSQPIPKDCKQVGFVDARNVHGDPTYMRNKLRNDSAELGASHVHIDDFNRLYASGTAFVCPQVEGADGKLDAAAAVTPPAPRQAPSAAPPAADTDGPDAEAAGAGAADTEADETGTAGSEATDPSQPETGGADVTPPPPPEHNALPAAPRTPAPAAPPAIDPDEVPAPPPAD